MNKVIGILVSLSLALPAHAGSLVFEGEVENEVLVADEAMGGSNASWIIPLIAIGVIALAVSSGGDDDDDDEESCSSEKPDIGPAAAVEPAPCR